MPARLQLCDDWHLVYSLEQDGVSLGTLYKKCEDLRGLRNGFVLVVRDGEGGVSCLTLYLDRFLLHDIFLMRSEYMLMFVCCQ